MHWIVQEYLKICLVLFLIESTSQEKKWIGNKSLSGILRFALTNLMQNTRAVAIFLSAFAALGGTAHAAALSVFPGSTLTLNFIPIGGVVTNLDVRGTGILIQEGTGAGAILTDFDLPSSPNQALFAINSTLTESLIVSFAPETLTFGPGLLTAFLVGNGAGAPTDLALLDLLGGNTYVFNNPRSANIVVDGITYELVSFDMLSVLDDDAPRVPEPSTLILLGFGGAWMMFLHRRRQVQTRGSKVS